VSGLPELHLARVVEQLLARAFLDERTASPPGQALDFHHDYFRRVIYTGLSAIQRQALHRRAARALLQIHRVRPGAVTEEVAYHFEQAGDPQAIGYLTQAAQAAADLFAYQHAAHLLSRALALHGMHRADQPAGRFDLLLAREAVLDRQGRRSEQAEDVAALLELAEALGDAARLALACVRQAGLLTYTRQYADARRAGEQALVLYREVGDPAGEARALRELGFLHWSAGDYSTALAYGQDALQLHRRLSDVEGEATALHNLAEITRSLGSARQALAQYEGALHLHWARQDRRCQGLTLYGMAHAWRQLGVFDQALARYGQALAHCQAAGDRLMASRAHHALAGLHWEAGASAPALEHLGRALDISREIGYGPGIAHGLLALGHFEARGGSLDAARQHLEEAMTWLRLMEDQARLAQAESMLRGLEEQGTLPDGELPAALGWVKTHVALAEGKVYCEFESPMALSPRDD
jgi:tetratricopeptide (TPR) repeat protein